MSTLRYLSYGKDEQWNEDGRKKVLLVKDQDVESHPTRRKPRDQLSGDGLAGRTIDIVEMDMRSYSPTPSCRIEENAKVGTGRPAKFT